jgi:hypothetical protein
MKNLLKSMLLPLVEQMKNRSIETDPGFMVIMLAILYLASVIEESNGYHNK